MTEQAGSVPHAETKPSVGVVLLNYNQDSYTLDCIDSLLADEYQDLRIVVVDNTQNGTLQSKLTGCRMDQILVIANDLNTGFCGGNNQGIRWHLEQGVDYVLILNNDTILERGCVSRLVKAAEEQPVPTVVTAKIMYDHDRTLIWYAGGHLDYLWGLGRHERFREHDDGRLDSTRRVTYTTGCCMLVPRSVYEQFGLMKEELFAYMDDTEYSMRLHRAGVPIAYEPSAVLYHRVSGGKSPKDYSPAYLYYITRNRAHVGGSLWYRSYLATVSLVVALVRYLYVLLLHGDSWREQVQAIAAGISDSADLRRNRYADGEPSAPRSRS